MEPEFLAWYNDFWPQCPPGSLPPVQQLYAAWSAGREAERELCNTQVKAAVDRLISDLREKRQREAEDAAMRDGEGDNRGN